MITRLFLSILGGFISAIALFFLIVTVTMPPAHYDTSNKEELVPKADTNHNQTLNCLEQNEDIQKKLACFSQQQTDNPPAPAAQTENLETCYLPTLCHLSKQLFIQIIYLLQFIALWAQTSVTLYVLIGTTENLENLLGSIGRWAIDSPPVIGVVGTLYAFSYAAAVASADGTTRQLTEVFKAAFNDAVLTTMFGGIIYVINLALNIIKDSNVEV